MSNDQFMPDRYRIDEIDHEIMGYIGPNIMNSLTDAASGVCGFRVYNMPDGISLAAEWSHSLNMLDIDISSIYEEVCQRLVTDSGSVDVVVSCDQTKIAIGFFVNLRNSTPFEAMDNVSTFYGTKGTAVSDIVIDACVWENMMVDGVRAILHTDTHSTSCCFQFSEWEDQAPGTGLIGPNYTVLIHITVILLLALSALLIWCGVTRAAGQAIICQYIIPVIYPSAQDGPFCN